MKIYATKATALSCHLSVLAVVIGFSGGVSGETWTSPDGFLMVRQPDSPGFERVESPPAPFLALWVSRDDMVKMGVMKLDVPPGVTFNQEAAEAGFAEEIGGSVTQKATRQSSGYEVLVMSGANDATEITQAIVINRDELYKLLAVNALGDEGRDAVNQFIDSLEIPAAGEPPVSASVLPAAQPSSNTPGLDLHDLSKKIGAAGFLLLLAIVILIVLRSQKSKAGKPKS